jgi:hypothetical protein
MLVEERRKRLLEEDLRREPPKEELHIVTGSIPMLRTVICTPGLRIAIHGGEPHPGTGALVGPLALGSLEKMRFDWAIISRPRNLRGARSPKWRRNGPAAAETGRRVHVSRT